MRFPYLAEVFKVFNLLFRGFRPELGPTADWKRWKLALRTKNAATLVVLLATLTACRTIPPLPTANLSEPGWTVQQGQALWKPRKNGPEIAGEVVAATRADGQTLLQFIKTPFPIVIAQTTSNLWRLEIPSENRVVAGRGLPPSRAGWLQLARALSGKAVAQPWGFRRDGTDWRLENSRSGEVVSGYFSP